MQLIKEQGATILLTTHYMEEAYELCDEIAIMDHGRIIAHDAPDALPSRSRARMRRRSSGISKRSRCSIVLLTSPVTICALSLR